MSNFHSNFYFVIDTSAITGVAYFILELGCFRVVTAVVTIVVERVNNFQASFSSYLH